MITGKIYVRHDCQTSTAPEIRKLLNSARTSLPYGDILIFDWKCPKCKSKWEIEGTYYRSSARLLERKLLKWTGPVDD